MNKAFTRETDEEVDDDVPEGAPPLPAGAKQLHDAGRLRAAEGRARPSLATERPELVATIAWAAGNGDRSENGDYIYGKKRLREIDRRIRFLVQAPRCAPRSSTPKCVAATTDDDRVYFGATVTVRSAKGGVRTVSIVGVDEIDTARGYISWVSPMARALHQGARGRHCDAAHAGRRRGARDSRSEVRAVGDRR